ncbi:hypothetical protein [uncultured Dokdonia sp.]|uniref:hypothetical protein n=1 Tax=uncultured Dokdonia sp. TaxID=575653 RepID=UPI002629424A|nr:hypothetical protein [uncultured Dokdonia sp.]
MNLKKSVGIAVILGIAFITVWELYVRSLGYVSELDDNKALWAIQRAKVDKLSSDDVVLLGSSRVHFDIQLNEWEEATGVRPIMLASDGTTPTPIFKEIVEETDFKGTVVIGVAPALFFSQPEKGFMWDRPTKRLRHYYEQTYAQRANHYLSVPLERSFSFLNASEEEWSDDIDLKTLVNTIKIGNRGPEGRPPFNNFGFVDADRNVTMFEKTKTDTAFANGIVKIWLGGIERRPTPVVDSVILYYQPLIEKFKKRGGNAIFLRCPSNGKLREKENEIYSRTVCWDELLLQSGLKGYHFEDYPKLNQFTCPEQSHLFSKDARIFTKELVKILLEDEQIPNLKTR